MPRYLARCAADLPANPAGVLGVFAVTVPTGTTAIAGDAFTKCKGLAQVTLPASVTMIEAGDWVHFDEDDDEYDDEDGGGGEERGAFSGCLSLREIALPPNLTEIRNHAFHGCTSLSKITLPPNITKIGGSAFSRCTSLSEITLPPNLTEIGRSAFEGCTSLSEITLLAGPVDIGLAAFYNCPGTLRRPDG